MLMAVFILSPHGDPTSHFMDTFNSLKANVDRLWPCSISSVPSLPPSVVLRQPHRQAGIPVISRASLTSHPAAQHSSPHPHGGDLQHWMREQGPLYLLQERPGLSQPFFLASPPMCLSIPSRHITPQELGQDQELKSCTSPTGTQSHHHSQHTTSSPALIKPTDTHT